MCEDEHHQPAVVKETASRTTQEG